MVVSDPHILAYSFYPQSVPFAPHSSEKQELYTDVLIFQQEVHGGGVPFNDCEESLKASPFSQGYGSSSLAF
ncbi:hypothetical protein I79_003106 [Cricetulus griseus]|uniref:Uncharacterized protein n=1 Tax=Cricetulus griseus TaxID=10029 RepID=G3GZ75_CRIGR|nr:hypothetical protein I79_003106 [Cricetulus griseus]